MVGIYSVSYKEITVTCILNKMLNKLRFFTKQAMYNKNTLLSYSKAKVFIFRKAWSSGSYTLQYRHIIRNKNFGETDCGPLSTILEKNHILYLEGILFLSWKYARIRNIEKLQVILFSRIENGRNKWNTSNILYMQR